MKIGLVLEGGAMRGLFTAGVMDVLMENNINLQGAVGVSAGAVFGCNIKSRQKGRVVRYVTKYCKESRFGSWYSWLTTGNYYGREFGYHELVDVLDPFDREAFKKNPMEFYAVATDINTGEPVYHKCFNADFTDLEWFRASSAMPLVSQIVKIGQYQLLDGGVSDSIPLRFFELLGYQRNIVVLTQPLGFVKQKNPLLPLVRLLLGRYPAFVEAMAERHFHYNATIQYILERENAGRALVIRPPVPLGISNIEKDPVKLRAVYDMGRKAATVRLAEIKKFTLTQN